MKKTIWTLLVLSLAANGWLLSRRDLIPPVVSPTLATRTTATATSGGAAKSAAELKTTAESAVADAHRAKLIRTLVTMDSDNVTSVRDQLRADGADETLIYGLIDGILRLRFNHASRTAELENLHAGWWRGTPARGGNYPSWSKVAMAPLFESLGPDPMDIVDFSSRFDFLPPEKAKLLAKMAVDYNELQARVSNAGLTPDARASQMLTEERRKDVMNLLTPEERAEYDLRFSEIAGQNARRYTRMQVTEQEFRAIQPAVEQWQQEVSSLPRDQNYTAASRALEQRTFDQLVTAVGYDRAIDYLWSGTTLTGRNSLSLALTALPSPSYAGAVLQLAAETGAAAAAIHADPNRSPDEKRAELLALQQATQPKLDRVLPSDVQASLDPPALRWLNALGKGEYMLITPRLSGEGVPMQTYSITTPARPAPSPVFRAPAP